MNVSCLSTKFFTYYLIYMARRSSYPFSKADTKFGTNLIASLLSIPLALGAKAIINSGNDLLSSQHENPNKISNNNSSAERLSTTELAIGAIVLILLLALGVYCMCLPEGNAILNFFGEILLIISLFGLIGGISTLFRDNAKESKTERDIKEIQRGYQWIEIDEALSKIFYQSLNIELYFHFTRPLMIEEDYKKINSKRFKKNLKTYQDYKANWNCFYWNYSFQKKVHCALRETVQTILHNSPVVTEGEFYSIMDKAIKTKLNYSESEVYVHKIQDVKNCCSYSFVVDILLPHKDDEKELSRRLNWDLMNRKEKFLRDIYLIYAGTWKPELLKQLEEYETAIKRNYRAE